MNFQIYIATVLNKYHLSYISNEEHTLQGFAVVFKLPVYNIDYSIIDRLVKASK